jgi:hypothetical protein
MTDHVAAARDRLTLAARTTVSLAVSNELEPVATFAAGQLDALIGIGHALLALDSTIARLRGAIDVGTDQSLTVAVETLTATITGPDGILDRLGTIADPIDRMRSDVADIARLANTR